MIEPIHIEGYYGAAAAKRICDYVESLESELKFTKQELAYCRKALGWLANVHPRF